MLIGLGIALIAILFGGSQSNLLFTEIDSYVKKNVDDKERKELVLSEIKAVKETPKELPKENKKIHQRNGPVDK